MFDWAGRENFVLPDREAHFHQKFGQKSTLKPGLLENWSCPDLAALLCYFDPHLSYNKHIIKTFSSYMSSLGQIKRVKHAFDRGTLLIVMKALVFRKLFYCSNMWANCSELNIDATIGKKNFACRIVSGIRKYDHVIQNWLKRLKLNGFQFPVS